MTDFRDYIERAVSGGLMSESDFNMKYLIPNIRKIVKDYDIRYSPENPSSSDNNLADRLFEAAIELVINLSLIHI